MIQARSLQLSYGNKDIFDNVSFVMNQDDRIGLAGRNGSGKTTLLKAIMDPSFLDSGTISIQSKKKIVYMPQEIVLKSTLSILEEALTSCLELYSLQKEMKEIELAFEKHPTDELVERYGKLCNELASYEPEVFKAKAKKILIGLGFSEQQFDQPVSILSGGWKMRVVLAKLLLQEADFYLFDEPTNHLDLTAKEWFLDYLKKADFGFILICHERYFLDELCTKIVELELGKATWYSGNYDDYLIAKEEYLQRLHAAYTQQQKEIKQKQEVINRFKAGQKAKMAISMERALEKMERIEIPPSPKNVRFNFPEVAQSGKEVMKVSNLGQQFNTHTLFGNISFEIKRGQKVALIAPNGVGKTTLFNLIVGKLPLQKGTITFGHNVQHAIFAQDQDLILQGSSSILDNIKNLCPRAQESTIRAFLGAFLFSGDDVFKKVSVLSGGEKNRVGIVSILLQQANLLLLDEPTNHLDIPSKEILLNALQKFNGTIFFVSHDRDFINALATDIIELTPKAAHYYQGNYDAYWYHKMNK